MSINKSKNAAIYLFANVINGFLPLLLLPLFTKYMSPSEYGVVALFQVLFSAFNILLMPYVTAAERSYFDEKISSKLYVSSCIYVITLVVLFIFVILIISNGYIDKILNLQKHTAIFAAIVSFCSVLVQLRLSQWLVRKKAYKYAFLQISISVLVNLISLLLIVELLLGANGRIYSFLVVYIIGAILALISFSSENMLTANMSDMKKYINDILGFSLPLLPHLAGVFLLTIADRLIINKNLGLESVGLYMVSFQIMTSVSLFSDAVNKFFSPIQMEELSNDTKESKCRVVFWIYTIAIIIAIVSIVALILAEYLIINYLDIKYLASKEILIWFAIGHFFNGIYLIIINNIYYSKVTKYLSYSTMSVSLLHLIVFYYLSEHYGLKGAAMAFAISMFLRFCMTFLYSIKAIKLPWLVFLKWKVKKEKE